MLNSDQREHWNEIHSRGGMNKFSDKQTVFAENIEALIKPKSSILELGCGEGNDSAYFSKKGHIVLATDFSNVIIEKNIERYKNVPNLQFKTMDISSEFDISNRFDLVYARLSLHYFTDQKTREIFNIIKEILNESGILAFMCKSIHDSSYGAGEEIEKDIFLKDGHLRHLFSLEYTKKLVEGMEVIELKEEKSLLYDQESSFISCVCRKNN